MKRIVPILLAAGIVGLVAAGCGGSVSPAESPVVGGAEDEEVIPETPPLDEAAAPGETDKYEIKTTDAGVRYIVDPEKIVGGGPPKDGIPAIDHPKYVSVAEADSWIADNELVLTISHRGVVRVYPLQIMVWHEIVNDVIAGDPILITY
jgi:hypothetical protein